MCKAGDGKTEAAGALLVTENTELMSRDIVKYDQDGHSATSSNPSHSALSNNSQNRLYEKLSFSRQHLQTIGVLGNIVPSNQLLFSTPLLKF